MNCRICDSPTNPLPYPGWHRCPRCSSDSRDGGPTPYDEAYLERYRAHIDFEANLDSHRSNLDWFVDHSDNRRGVFLDVGCADCAAVEGMARRGWDAIGFDINPAAKCGSHPTLIAPAFKAWLSPKADCLLCRETIEHVEDWKDFLTQLTTTVKPGGLLQIQTPQPAEYHQYIYQEDHLQIFAPGVLEAELVARGFSVIESRQWTETQAGQKILARKNK